MFKRLLLVSAAALALSAAAFGSYTMVGHKGHAEAAPLISCAVDSSAPPQITVTCTGTIHIVTPFATKDLNFSLVVTATDSLPAGPSFGDVIIGCTLGVNGGAPQTVHVGPCP
jgi:hypothetical protein